MDFYTSVVKYGNMILYRGVKNGRRTKLKLNYSPTLYTETTEDSPWKTLDGNNLLPHPFESIKEASEYINRYNKVENFKIYGNASFNYSFIADEFKGMIDWDIDKIAVDIIDIETKSDNGFPDPYKAQEEITAITLTRLGRYPIAFGCGEYEVKGDEKYIKCRDEIDLCQQFMDIWSSDPPDVLSGWNSRYFDVPYLFNRFKILQGETFAKRLSPWNIVNTKTTFQKTTGKELTSYDLVGIGHLDYIELYKAFAKDGKTRENYKLNTIANVELGEGKLSYDEYDNLNQLYLNDYQKFQEYNIKDVDLIIRLEDKLKLIELSLTLAYDSKSNYEDVFTQTRMWDALTYNYLLEKHIIVPPKIMHEKESAFEGAFVKEPQVGRHKWVASFDLNSLYPNLIRQYNISPEKLVNKQDILDRIELLKSV